MKYTVIRGFGGLALVALAALATPAIYAAEYTPQARLSYDGGGALIKGPQDKDWARGSLNTLMFPGDTIWVDQGGATELELPDGVFLRLADDSKVEMVALPPEANLRGWVGAFYVQRVSRSQGTVFFTTPACVVQVGPDTAVRVDIAENGGATVSVRWGVANVRTDAGGEVSVTEGNRAWVDVGMLPSDPVAFDRNESDTFDQWNNERARVLAEGCKTLPKAVTIAPSVVGASDLNAYGEWVYVDNQPYWRPTVVVDYVPYRYGHWNYNPTVGHVWVGDYPFCYVTSHYGRWRHADAYGWIWSYDPVWSPAWAATVCVGDSFMWAPMDYYCRPVLVSSSTYFTVGGVQFCAGSTSWMSTTYITTGWGPVCPATPAYFDTVCALPPTQINIWNIYVDGDHHHRPRPPFDPGHVRVRDYNPPRSIRGLPESMDNKGSARPADRAQMLEARLNRPAFSTADRSGMRKERSAVPADNQRSGLRSVRMDRASALQPEDTPARRAEGRDPQKATRGVRQPGMEASAPENGRAGRNSTPDRGVRNGAVSTENPRTDKVVGAPEANPLRTAVPGRSVDNNGRASRNVRGVPTINNETVAPRRVNTVAPDARHDRTQEQGVQSPVDTSPGGTAERTDGRGMRTTAPKMEASPRGAAQDTINTTPNRETTRPSRQVAVRDIDPGTPAPTTPRPSTPRGAGPSPRPSTPPPSTPPPSPRPSTRGFSPYEAAPNRNIRSSVPEIRQPERTEMAAPRYENPAPSRPRFETPVPQQPSPRFEAPVTNSMPSPQPRYSPEPTRRQEVPQMRSPEPSSRGMGSGAGSGFGDRSTRSSGRSMDSDSGGRSSRGR